LLRANLHGRLSKFFEVTDDPGIFTKTLLPLRR
jgi:hypothetical protein